MNRVVVPVGTYPTANVHAVAERGAAVVDQLIALREDAETPGGKVQAHVTSTAPALPLGHIAGSSRQLETVFLVYWGSRVAVRLGLSIRAAHSHSNDRRMSRRDTRRSCVPSR